MVCNHEGGLESTHGLPPKFASADRGTRASFFMIKVNLWTTILHRADDSQVGSYDLPQMLHYQSWAFVVSLLIYGFNSQNLAEDIRHGRISSYLVYPFGFWQHHAAKFLAFLALQGVVVSVVLVFCYGFSWVPPLAGAAFLSGILLSLVMSFVWYNLQFIFGICGFWLDETWVLRVMFMVLTSFLSGAIIPLDLFPERFRQVLDYTIFPLLTFVPVRLFMGESIGSWWHWAAVLGLWALGTFLLAGYLWRKGVRLYTGAGI